MGNKSSKLKKSRQGQAEVRTRNRAPQSNAYEPWELADNTREPPASRCDIIAGSQSPRYPPSQKRGDWCGFQH